MSEVKKRGRPPKANVERRRKRNVLGRGRYKLSTPEIPGYKTRWANDDGIRIQELTEMNDYDFVLSHEISNEVGDPNVGGGNQDLGARVSRVVGTKANGDPLYAYLLKIKKEFYEADQKEKQDRIDEVERQIKRGQFDQQIENKYGKVQIKRRA